MIDIYQAIVAAKSQKRKLLAILLDPDKIKMENLRYIIEKILESPATHVFVGGSHVQNNILDELILRLKEEIHLPLLLFPGNPSQISNHADAILFLSLISGRNPDYLIGHQIQAAPILRKSKLEIIPTGYMLIESGSQTAVARISKTQPLDRNDLDYVLHTAQAGALLGHKLIYLEAGSGAKRAVPPNMIKKVADNIDVPLIVGGGIVDLQGIKQAYEAGADLVVIGTAFENDPDFFTNIV